MRGAPQSGLSALISPISARSSVSMWGALPYSQTSSANSCETLLDASEPASPDG
jgi:hypothetical protein